MEKILLLNCNDNVGVALDDLAPSVNGQLKIIMPIKRGHKVAVTNIDQGEEIIKYGVPIGRAKQSIKAGEHVHTHNVITNLDGKTSYQYLPKDSQQSKAENQRLINVFLRPNGQIGIRNELWIIPTVGCINGTATALAKNFSADHDLSAIDGVWAYPHPYGCSQMGEDQQNTLASLAGIIRHPNAGGVLVLGLGCENCQINLLKKELAGEDLSHVIFLSLQEAKDEIAEGLQALETLLLKMNKDRRTKQPISKLAVGLKCGGSDGLSGVTANPLLGRFSDWLVNNGGTTVLTEIPEMFGAEQILLNRCTNKAIFDKLTGVIDDFKDFYHRHNQVIYENPSPGNKEGGITTLEDKSLGCVQKGGSSPVTDVLKLGEKLAHPGLNVVSGPGNDLVAVTALGIAGCQLVLFTTGRGTPFGGFIPTLKVSTNSDLADRKPGWIDFDAGKLLTGLTIDQLTNQFVDLIITICEGKRARNEQAGYKDIAFFKTGVTL